MCPSGRGETNVWGSGAEAWAVGSRVTHLSCSGLAGNPRGCHSSQDCRAKLAGRVNRWVGFSRGQEGWPCRPILPSLIPDPALTLTEAQASPLGAPRGRWVTGQGWQGSRSLYSLGWKWIISEDDAVSPRTVPEALPLGHVSLGVPQPVDSGLGEGLAPECSAAYLTAPVPGSLPVLWAPGPLFAAVCAPARHILCACSPRTCLSACVWVCLSCSLCVAKRACPVTSLLWAWESCEL